MGLVVRVPLRDGGWRQAELVEGPAGWGECSALPGYPCDPTMARAAAEEAACVAWPDAVRDEVEVNALVPWAPVDEAARFAEEAVADGYRCLKVKVGGEHGTAVVAAVREAAGPHVAIRVDVNGRWDVERAAAEIAELSTYGIEYVEQPVATLEELAELRRLVRVPLAADECVRSVEDARRLARLGAADVLVVKVQPLGGVRRAIDVAEAAGGIPVVVTSMMETSVGLAAGLALAAALPEHDLACGLGTGVLLAGDVVAEPLVPEDGRLRVRRPAPDPELLDRYRVAP
ncbi:MAG: enolase C-terminal domain-like protein [Acidimicrobiia bacterium]